jgi:PAS domain S-box-containing protein
MVMKPNDTEELEQGLPGSPDLLGGIIGSAMDAIIAIDDSQRIILFNAAAEKILACPANEALGGSVERFIPERFRAGHGTRVHGFAESGITNRTLHGLGTLWGLRATGDEFPMEASISKVESGGKKFFTVVIRDITERQRAEEALRASEERLRLAQQAACIGAFEWNIQTGLNTWTPELEAMYGLPVGGFGGTQTAFENLVHPDDRAGVIELDDWALKTGLPTKGQWRVVWPDGSVHWIAGRWQVYMNESGQPSRMVGVNMDITDRKLAEEALARANERLRLALEAGSAGGWDYDLKTGKDVWFGKAHAQLGMTPDETSGSRKEFWDRLHPDDRERVEHALQVAKEKGEDFAEDVRVVWRDGTTHWLRSRGRFQYAADGEAERSLGVSLDITERKMAEDRLREYEEAVEGAEDMIGVIDRRCRFLLANRQYLKMRNLTREQVVGHFVSEVLNKEIFEAVVKPKLDECFQGKVVRYEMKFSYPTVGERDLLLSYFPIEGVNGVDRVACILHDITDRKRAEEALLVMNRTLEAQGSLLRSRQELLKVFVKT